MGVLSRLAGSLTMRARISIYKSIIAPHFDYCSSLLFLGDQSTFDRMQLIQNRAMRSVLLCKKLTPIRYKLDTLEWLTVKQRVYANTLTFIYKLRSGLLPEYECMNKSGKKKSGKQKSGTKNQETQIRKLLSGKLIRNHVYTEKNN